MSYLTQKEIVLPLISITLLKLAEIFHGIRIIVNSGWRGYRRLREEICDVLLPFLYLPLFVRSFHGALGNSISCLNFIPGSSRLRIVFPEYSFSHKDLSTFTRKGHDDLCKNFRTRWSTRLLRFP